MTLSWFSGEERASRLEILQFPLDPPTALPVHLMLPLEPLNDIPFPVLGQFNTQQTGDLQQGEITYYSVGLLPKIGFNCLFLSPLHIEECFIFVPGRFWPYCMD